MHRSTMDLTSLKRADNYTDLDHHQNIQQVNSNMIHRQFLLEKTIQFRLARRVQGRAVQGFFDGGTCSGGGGGGGRGSLLILLLLSCQSMHHH